MYLLTERVNDDPSSENLATTRLDVTEGKNNSVPFISIACSCYHPLHPSTFALYITVKELFFNFSTFSPYHHL